ARARTRPRQPRRIGCARAAPCHVLLRSDLRRGSGDATAGAWAGTATFTGAAAYIDANLRKALATLDRGWARTTGLPSAIVRGTSRWLGMRTSGARPRIEATSSWLM